MKRSRPSVLLFLGSFLLLSVQPAGAQNGHHNKKIVLSLLGTYASGAFNARASEISAHDPATQRVFVTNRLDAAVDVLDISNPATPVKMFAISLSSYGAGATSVAVKNGVVAVAVEASVKTDPGQVVFFDADGNYLNALTVGSLPDMVTFTRDGKTLLTANEGEPSADYSVDPVGSVSIIDMSHGAASLTAADVSTADFSSFTRASLDPSVRIYGPNASVAQDLEPEFITVSEDSKTAWVTLQENNAIGILDLEAKAFTSVVGMGFANRSVAGSGFDPSDKDGVRISTWPVFGMYEPDNIASFRHHGRTYLVTANEGDGREYTTFVEEARAKSLALDPVAFPNAATLKLDANLGRLNVTKTLGDLDNDGDYDQLYALGGRSFSILDDAGQMIFDSGDQFEQITAAAYPANFNASNSSNAIDDRSDNKGPEPEAVTVGDLFGRTYAFIGLERIGGLMVYDLSKPSCPRFVQYINNRDFAGNPATGTAKDLAPEGIVLIPAHKSPNHKPMLVVTHEVSGTTSLYQIDQEH